MSGLLTDGEGLRTKSWFIYLIGIAVSTPIVFYARVLICDFVIVLIATCIIVMCLYIPFLTWWEYPRQFTPTHAVFLYLTIVTFCFPIVMSFKPTGTTMKHQQSLRNDHDKDLESDLLTSKIENKSKMAQEACLSTSKTDKPTQQSELCQYLISLIENCESQSVNWSPEVCDKYEQDFDEYC